MKRNFVLLAGIGLSWVCTAGAAPFGDVQARIIGGLPVSAADPIAASTVLIMGPLGSGEGHSICTGSLIAPGTVLTAAHCVAENPLEPSDPAQMVVAFSRQAPMGAGDPATRRVSGYRAHPGWTGEINRADVHDIAVIRFVGAAPRGYAPVALLPGTDGLVAGQAVILAGFGVTSGQDFTGETAGRLRKVEVNILQRYGDNEIMVDESHGKGACGGDSGGPAFVKAEGRPLLWGVTSRGDGACRKVGIYTQIRPYMDFIESAARELSEGR